jgi:hypothetical protein
MKPFQPTDEDRIAILPHVLYEVSRVFIHEGNLLENEAFLLKLIHGRTLIDFFEHEVAARTNDDVLAEDYGFPASPLGMDPTLRERINKDLAHLTYHRLRHTAETAPWKLWLLDPLKKRSIDYLQHLMKQSQFRLPDEVMKDCRELHGMLTTLRAVTTEAICSSSQAGL